MAKRRDQIRMTEEEMWAFIEERKSLQVATLNRDGTPHLTTLWFAIVDGALVFETFTKSQKVKNLQRDPRIAVLLEDGTEYAELRGVSINAKAEVHSDPDKVHGLAKQVMIRNNPDVPAEAMDQAAKQLAAKRSAIVVRLEKVVTWDHRKLGGSY
ncbi:MAG: TIGR03618 family F420-dependent PPOX class oxidoreductase [Myxococcales bacterium]|nr:TIGR03618 family F420-dependent PPOX class oxidoreductase [Myxococcales bacterium]